MPPIVLAPRECLYVLAGILAAARAAGGADTIAEQEAPASKTESEGTAPPDEPSTEAPQGPWRTFEFTFGAEYSAINSSITLVRKGGLASLAVEPEQALEFEDEILSPEVWTALRIGERHRIQFAFDDFTRNATATLSKDISFNGNTYTVGTSIQSTPVQRTRGELPIRHRTPAEAASCRGGAYGLLRVVLSATSLGMNACQNIKVVMTDR